MPILIFRGNKTKLKQDTINLIVNKFCYKLYDLQTLSIDRENEEILSNMEEISNTLNLGNVVLISGYFHDESMIQFLFKSLNIENNLMSLLIKTDEENLPISAEASKHEIIIWTNEKNIDNKVQGIHNIVLNMRSIEYYVNQINTFRSEKLDKELFKKDPSFFETTSYFLYSVPIYGIAVSLVDILKLYHIDNNKENSLNLLLEVVKLVQVMGFNIRKGAKFYRVCYYKKCANYKRMDQLWYPPKPKKDVRITSIEEPVLFIGEHWGSSFLEVFDNSVKKRPFIILELEVTKPFRINYIAPLNLEKHAGASSNNMYMDYCRDCKKIEPKLLALKEEMLRNYLGEFWISNKNFDKLFTYDFTKNISKLLLKRFKGDGLGYLSTQCNYQYNNFAIPASVADECLRPGEVILCDHTFWPNGRGQQPWINFKRIKSGFVDLKTKKIIFTKKYRSDDSYSI